jgi:hypothetical protein
VRNLSTADLGPLIHRRIEECSRRSDKIGDMKVRLALRQRQAGDVRLVQLSSSVRRLQVMQGARSRKNIVLLFPRHRGAVAHLVDVRDDQGVPIAAQARHRSEHFFRRDHTRSDRLGRIADRFVTESKHQRRDLSHEMRDVSGGEVEPMVSQGKQASC